MMFIPRLIPCHVCCGCHQWNIYKLDEVNKCCHAIKRNLHSHAFHDCGVIAHFVFRPTSEEEDADEACPTVSRPERNFLTETRVPKAASEVEHYEHSYICNTTATSSTEILQPHTTNAAQNYYSTPQTSRSAPTRRLQQPPQPTTTSVTTTTNSTITTYPPPSSPPTNTGPQQWSPRFPVTPTLNAAHLIEMKSPRAHLNPLCFTSS